MGSKFSHQSPARADETSKDPPNYDDCPHNEIRPWNELALVYSGVNGPFYQLTSPVLDLENVTMTIASVWLGLRQIKYPFQISLVPLQMERLDQVRSLQTEGFPQRTDALMMPFAFALNGSDADDPSERRVAHVPTKAGDAKRRRISTKDKPQQIFGLAIFEPTNTRGSELAMDIRAFGPVLGSHLEGPATGFFDRIVKALNASQWNRPYHAVSKRHILGPTAPPARDAYITILHAWAYMLDLPVRESLDLKSNPKINDEFFRQLWSLFNLALDGGLEYERIRNFLEEADYIFPEPAARAYQTLPDEKYRRHLSKFCSVKMRPPGQTTWKDQVYRVLASKASLEVKSHLTPARAKIFPNTAVDVYNAIGVVWGANFDRHWPYPRTGPGFALYDKDYKAFPSPSPRSSPVLLMVHQARTSSWRHIIKEKSVVLSAVYVKDRDNVVVVNYTYDVRIMDQAELERDIKKTLERCEWHPDKKYKIHNRFTRTDSGALSSKGHALSQIFYAWCLLLGLKTSENKEFIKEITSRSDAEFIARGQTMVHLALEGKVTIGAIEAFLHESGFGSGSRTPMEVFRNRPQLATHNCSVGGNELTKFIRNMRHSELRMPLSRTSNKKTTAPQMPEVGIIPPSAEWAPIRPLKIVEAWEEHGTFAECKFYDMSGHVANTWMIEFKEHLAACREQYASLKNDPRLEDFKFTSKAHNPTGQWGLEYPGTEPTYLGRGIACLWEPLRDSNVRYAFVPGEVVPALSLRESSRTGIPTAAGGPYDFIMPMYSADLAGPSPPLDVSRSSDSNVGHMWVAFAELVQPQPGFPPPMFDPDKLTPRPYLAPCKVKPSASRKGGAGQSCAASSGKSTSSVVPGQKGTASKAKSNSSSGSQSRPGTFVVARDPHVRLMIMDSWEAATGKLPHRTEKTVNLVRFSGWAVGCERRRNKHGASEYIPLHWDPRTRIIRLPCPQQDHPTFSGLSNCCGILAIFNAWARMLGLRPASKGRSGNLSGKEFWKAGLELLDLALLGCVTTRTIQAFFNAYGYLETEEPLAAAVYDVTTMRNGDTYGQRLQQYMKTQVALDQPPSPSPSVADSDDTAPLTTVADTPEVSQGEERAPAPL